MILVTGGAGFIGANFVLDWLAATGEPVVNLDKLTYAGNLGNLAALARRRAPRVRARRHRRPRRGRAALLARAPAARDRELRRRDATSTARSTAPPRSSQTNVVGTFELLEAARAYWMRRCPQASASISASCTCRPTRCTARSAPTRPGFTETTPYAPNSPYSASKAASDHLVRAYHHTYGAADAHDQLLEQLRPVPVPREADPADDRQRARRQAAAGVRRRAERARLALRRRSLRGDPRRARARAPRRDLQRRRQRRDEEPRRRAHDLRGARARAPGPRLRGAHHAS